MLDDRLKHMFSLREKFMKELSEKVPASGPSEWPLDLSDKKNQRILRDVALRGVEEIFEALQHFKNWKTHRLSEEPDFDREKFLTEIVDAFNFFYSLLILAGYSDTDLYESYIAKDKVIHERLKNGY